MTAARAVDPARAPGMRVLGFAGFRRSVSDLQRSIAFYRDGLGFDVDAAAAPESKRARLRLGAQSIELVEDSSAMPADRYAGGGIDTRFQHLAIVAADMASACDRLARCRPVAVSRGGPVHLPESAGGVSAFKFLDPDGHPLELIHFPPGSGAAVWQRPHAAGPTLGIDHSAIVVRDVDRSIAFYRDGLGFAVAARQVNGGPTQARLDGVDAVEVDVVALRPATDATPHLELLGYRGDALRAAPPGDGADTLLWFSDDASGPAAQVGAATAASVAPRAGEDATGRPLRDPDGHRHLLLGPRP